MKLIDITGSRFGLLVVYQRQGVDSTGKTTWLCRCDCGSNAVISGLNLKTGNTKSCGCLINTPDKKRLDLAGARFGRLVCREIHKIISGVVWWECVCDCGITANVTVAHLTTGHTLSCGCFSRETSALLAKKNLGGKKENHPRWRSELTEDERRLLYRRSTHWGKKVVKRDGFCMKCFKGDGLHVHHIVGVSVCHERREDFANAAALCGDCHKKFHKKYGYTGFTRRDFFEFIGAPDPGDYSLIAGSAFGARGNALKYILRAGKKGSEIEDLKKAAWYINREIERLKNEH